MKKATALLVLVLASVALVACGSSDDDSTGASTSETTTESSGGPAGGALEIAAAESGLAYASDTASSEGGKVDLVFNNPQPLAHDVAIEDSGGKTIGQTEIVTEGTDSTTVALKPGAYKYYCTVPGHREAGMEGTLTVE
jgi:plastocyanin